MNKKEAYELIKKDKTLEEIINHFGDYSILQRMAGKPVMDVREWIEEKEGAENGAVIDIKEKGGKVNDELADMAWDIGIQNKWIMNGGWKDEETKQRAFNLAKAELYHFAKGGKTGMLDGIDWIITGKSKK